MFIKKVLLTLNAKTNYEEQLAGHHLRIKSKNILKQCTEVLCIALKWTIQNKNVNCKIVY